MRFMLNIGRAYPTRTLLTLFALLIAGLVQAVSLSALLPVLSVAMDPEGSTQASGGMLVADVLRDAGIAPTLGVLLSLIVIGMALKSVLMLFAKRYVGYTVAQVGTDLRLRLLRALVEARWDYFLTQPVGNLTNGMATEARRASNAYLNGARTVAIAIEASVYIAVSATVSWEATLVALAVGGFIMLAFSRLVRSAKRAGKRQTVRMKTLIRVMTDTLHSVKALKAMGLADRASVVLASETGRLNKALRREVFSTEALNALYEPLIVAFVAVGLYFALTKFDLPVPHVLVLVLLLVRVLGSFGKVQKSHQNMAVAESAYWSLLQTIQATEAAHERADDGLQPSLQRDITLRELRFRFGDREILKGLNLSLPVGSFTTLIGASGSGKTTVIDLITGLLKPTAGEVLIDGVPLQDYSLSQWRHLIGYVPQEALLLNDTVLHNVTLGDPELDEADAERALRAAEAWPFVAAMPEGMQTVVGERGGRLSGGQRQRLCIARALVRRPKLLILDEATSALDPQSEAALCDTLSRLRGQMTVLAVSHQTGMATIADRVLRLHDGVLVAAVPELKGYAAGENRHGKQVSGS